MVSRYRFQLKRSEIDANEKNNILLLVGRARRIE